MKKIGLIGGISWISTMEYYRHINNLVNERLGGLNFAECLIYSFNYADIKKNNDANDWDKTFDMIFKASMGMKNSGAEAIILCANTMHMVAEPLREKIGIPVIHIAEATADEISKKKIGKAALLGTKFTMEKDFFREKLAAKSIETIIPSEADRDFIHYTIFEELGRGIFSPATKEKYLQIIEGLISQGAGGIILGCTEIPLLLKQEDIPVPSFDTTLIHSEAAVKFMLSAS